MEKGNFMQDCFESIEYADKIVALTGAGVSTLSGIRDFRGENGIYIKDPFWKGFPVENLLDTDFFRKHPDLFYQYARENLYPMTNCPPSIAHRTLALMEKRGLLDMLYTQNIDLLHSKAGSSRLREFHGSLRGHSCIQCKGTFEDASIRERIFKGEIPVCPSCGGLLKPDIVFYGDPMDEKLLDQAFHDFESADILIVMGTSLTVPPVSGLPMASILNQRKLLIVNASPTKYDEYAAWHFPDIEKFCKKIDAYFSLCGQ